MQFIDLAAQQTRIKTRIDARIQAVLAHGKYILGPEVFELESQLSTFCGAKHTITCANGTDALQLALMALEVRDGDAVFVPSFTFAATAEVVPATGATPVFVDIDPASYNMDADSLMRAVEHAKSLGLRPAVVIPVDLFGLPADYHVIQKIARQQGMKIIADSAQGFGAQYGNQITGTLGDLTTTSFFPAKPLGCYGDGGAVMTDDPQLAEVINSLRFHGKGDDKYDNIRIGMNSRLDTIQAAILLEKLAIYPDEIERRQAVAKRYTDALAADFITPRIPEKSTSVWAQYTLRADSADQRGEVLVRLKSAGIPSAVYYPTPLHKLSAYKQFPTDPDGLAQSENAAKTVFSLPMHPYLAEVDIEHVLSGLLSEI